VAALIEAGVDALREAGEQALRVKPVALAEVQLHAPLTPPTASRTGEIS
jgi:hypothetical protein